MDFIRGSEWHAVEGCHQYWGLDRLLQTCLGSGGADSKRGRWAGVGGARDTPAVCRSQWVHRMLALKSNCHKNDEKKRVCSWQMPVFSWKKHTVWKEQEGAWWGWGRGRSHDPYRWNRAIRRLPTDCSLHPPSVQWNRCNRNGWTEFSQREFKKVDLVEACRQSLAVLWCTGWHTPFLPITSHKHND